VEFDQREDWLPPTNTGSLSLLSLFSTETSDFQPTGTAYDGNAETHFCAVVQDQPAPPPEGAQLDARDRTVAPATYQAFAQRLASILSNRDNRPFARAAALILLELNRIGSNPTTAPTNRRQLLGCLNHELRAHGLWVTYNPQSRTLVFRYADADANTFREARNGEGALPQITLSQAELEQARAKARLVHTGISQTLQDWAAVPVADRPNRLAGVQTSLRTAFETAVGNFLNGAQGPIRWEILRQELNNSLRLQRVEVDRIGNDQDGYTLVFYRLDNNFARGEELIRVPAVRVAPGDAPVVAGPQAGPGFAGIAEDISRLLRVFEQGDLDRFFREQFGPQGNQDFIARWCGPANSNDSLEVFITRRNAAAQRLNLAFEEANLPFRVLTPRQVDENDKRFGWELDIQMQLDGNWVTIGTGRPRDGIFRITPDLRFITGPEFQRRIADIVLACADNNFQIPREEQFYLAQAFRLFNEIIEQAPGREQEVNTARNRFCEMISTSFLHGHGGMRVTYEANHNGHPALRVIRPNQQDGFIPLVEPGPPASREAGNQLGSYLAYIGLGLVMTRLGIALGRGSANLILGRQTTTVSDTQRVGTEGAEMRPATANLADAPIGIEFDGHTIRMSPEEMRAFFDNVIRQQREINERELARLRALEQTPERVAEIRRIESEQATLRQSPAHEAEYTLAPGRAPGTRTFSRITVRGVIISSVAILTVLAAWYALSRNVQAPSVIPFR
jgi:hypothetical protein